MTAELFREDAYLRACEAVVAEVHDDMVELDRTVFYPAAGGQPGDTGKLMLGDSLLEVSDTRRAPGFGGILHVMAAPPPVGATVKAVLDWERRHRLMRMHTCLHLLCRAVDGAVTGGAIGDGKGRLDFNLPEGGIDKEALAERINAWIADDRAVTDRWIDEAELDARPDLVRTMSVSPPRGAGRIRLVEIDGVDLQACGGTHVRATGEIGPIRIGKVESKGKQNRRINIAFAD